MSEEGRNMNPSEDRNLANLTDEDLLDRFKQTGSEDAFNMLKLRHWDGLVRCCMRNLYPDTTSVDDVVQETFIKLFREAHKVRSVRGWLYSVARSKRRDYLRRRNTRKRHETNLDPPPVSQDPSQIAVVQETTEAVKIEVQHLPEKYRDTVILIDFQGHTVEKAAEILNRKKNTVVSQRSRAWKKLRKNKKLRDLPVLIPILLGRRPSATSSGPVVDATAKAALARMLIVASILAASITAGSWLLAATGLLTSEPPQAPVNGPGPTEKLTPVVRDRFAIPKNAEQPRKLP
jgi:RNA polymerase sigma-70 factor (ECF subfamily)